MSKLSELRARATASQQLTAERARAAAMDAIRGETFGLTVMNQGGIAPTEKQIQEVATRIATRVAEVATDPVNEFLDTCKVRGVKSHKIERAVELCCELFVPSEREKPYPEKLYAVALHFKQNPNYYDDIAALV